MPFSDVNNLSKPNTYLPRVLT